MGKGGRLLSYLDRYWVTEHHFKKGRAPIAGELRLWWFITLLQANANVDTIVWRTNRGVIHLGIGALDLEGSGKV